MKRVIIIQEHLPHYRIVFFELLKAKLGSLGFDLDVIHGTRRSNQFVAGDLPWATGVKIHRCGGVAWHRDTVIRCLKADLVISVHELKYLSSIVLQLATRWGGPRFAYWGHGRNFQARNINSWVESIKRIQARHVDWWFAYNQLCASVVRELGFPLERITSVENAIDTTRLIECRKALTDADLDVLRNRLGTHSNHIAIYTGALYPLKRIDFLIHAATLLRKKIADFELIVIGDGPDRHLVRDAAAQHAWIHDIGPKNDTEKVPYWALAKLLLMPGLVGLVVVDSFALGVPLITTDYPFHSPEIDYLENGVNGIIVACGDSPQHYAAEVAGLLLNPERLECLAAGARASASDHTIERMVESFATGITRALAMPHR